MKNSPPTAPSPSPPGSPTTASTAPASAPKATASPAPSPPTNPTPAAPKTAASSWSASNSLWHRHSCLCALSHVRAQHRLALSFEGCDTCPHNLNWGAAPSCFLNGAVFRSLIAQRFANPQSQVPCRRLAPESPRPTLAANQNLRVSLRSPRLCVILCSSNSKSPFRIVKNYPLRMYQSLNAIDIVHILCYTRQ